MAYTPLERETSVKETPVRKGGYVPLSQVSEPTPEPKREPGKITSEDVQRLPALQNIERVRGLATPKPTPATTPKAPEPLRFEQATAEFPSLSAAERIKRQQVAMEGDAGKLRFPFAKSIEEKSIDVPFPSPDKVMIGEIALRTPEFLVSLPIHALNFFRKNINTIKAGKPVETEQFKTFYGFDPKRFGVEEKVMNDTITSMFNQMEEEEKLNPSNGNKAIVISNATKATAKTVIPDVLDVIFGFDVTRGAVKAGIPSARHLVRQLPESLLVKFQVSNVPPGEIVDTLLGIAPTQRANKFISGLTAQERKDLFWLAREYEKAGRETLMQFGKREPTALGKFAGISETQAPLEPTRARGIAGLLDEGKPPVKAEVPPTAVAPEAKVPTPRVSEAKAIIPQATRTIPKELEFLSKEVKKLNESEFVAQFEEGLKSQNLTTRETAQNVAKLLKDSGFDTPLDFYNQVKGAEVPVMVGEGGERLFIEPRVTEVPRGQLPVGTGEVKATRLEARMRGLMGRINPELIEEAGLSTFRQMNQAEQMSAAAKYVQGATAEDILAVLKGEKPAPPGLIHNSIAMAAEKLGELTGDSDLILKLASLRSTRGGQEIGILRLADEWSPVTAIEEITAARMERATRKFGVRGDPDATQKSIRKQVSKMVGEGQRATSLKRLKIDEAERLLAQILC